MSLLSVNLDIIVTLVQGYVQNGAVLHQEAPVEMIWDVNWVISVRMENVVSLIPIVDSNVNKIHSAFKDILIAFVMIHRMDIVRTFSSISHAMTQTTWIVWRQINVHLLIGDPILMELVHMKTADVPIKNY